MSKQTRTAAKTNNTTRRIYEDLLNLIVEKELAPGSKINQNRLAERLRSSRTPIVKALHKLETQGLVDSIPDRGFYVHELSVLELVELWTLREALDSIVILELVETITPAQIEQIEEALGNFERSAADIDEACYRKADKLFHKLLLQFSRNLLVKKINDYFQIYNRCFTVGLLRKPQETLPEHRRMVEALKAKDRESAREAVVSHITRTKVFLQQLVQQLRKVGIDPASIPFKEAAGR
jgi:DNA-binding GntR family transcriptional regulator